MLLICNFLQMQFIQIQIYINPGRRLSVHKVQSQVFVPAFVTARLFCLSQQTFPVSQAHLMHIQELPDTLHMHTLMLHISSYQITYLAACNTVYFPVFNASSSYKFSRFFSNTSHRPYSKNPYIFLCNFCKFKFFIIIVKLFNVPAVFKCAVYSIQFWQIFCRHLPY